MPCQGKVAFRSFGCKLNQFETEFIREDFLRAGFREVGFSQLSDIYLINTCSVTSQSDYHARQAIRKARRLSPHSFIIATGCYAQLNPSALVGLADLVLGNREKRDVLHYLKGTNGGGKVFTSPSSGFSAIPRMVIGGFQGHTRAFIKVQDGCSTPCSFCIVPQARGRARSASLEDILSQIESLAQAGFKEVVLTGVNIGSLGANLIKLLERLEGMELPQRVRFSSIEPTDFTPELIDFVASSRKICPHFHIPLQSGDKGILQLMNRQYNPSFYEGFIRELRSKVPQAGIGADVLVGFPGEGEKAFRNTYQLVERLPLTYLHVFSYSPREGTPAAKFPDQVDPTVKNERSLLMRRLGMEKWRRFREGFLGQTLEILVERGEKEGFFTGLSGNYIRAYIKGGGKLRNRMVRVRTLGLKEKGVWGELVE